MFTSVGVENIYKHIYTLHKIHTKYIPILNPLNVQYIDIKYSIAYSVFLKGHCNIWCNLLYQQT